MNHKKGKKNNWQNYRARKTRKLIKTRPTAKIFKTSGNDIFFPKLFWSTVRKNSDQEKLLKFEAEGWEFANNLRLLEQFIRTVKGQNNGW